jgi:3-methylcrotonyl-CoA carboxylase alpha subunit
MKYPLQIGDKDLIVEIEESGKPRTVSAKVDDQTWPVSYRAVSPNTLHLEVDGTALKVCLAGRNGEKHIFIKGRVFTVSEKSRQFEKGISRRKADFSPGEVTPPMPAVVVRILVEEGDWVVQGQGLIVVSAMKMETTLKAPVEGKVWKIKTTLQAKVMPGDRLVEIKEGAKDE